MKLAMVPCPNCGVESQWTVRNKYRPFCSERCKLMDLGQWAAERYSVAGDQLDQEASDNLIQS